MMHFYVEGAKLYFVYTIKHKSKAPRIVQDFRAFVQNQYSGDIQVFYIDGERLLGKAFFI